MKSTAFETQNTATKTDPNADFFGKSVTPDFFSPATIQPKLTIGAPNDKYEKEADAMADKIVSGGTNATASASNQPGIQRACADCEKEGSIQRMSQVEEEESIQRKSQEEEDEPAIQRMAEEEEAVQPKLMRKSANGGGVATAALSSQLNSSKGGGSPMSADTNASMSQAFGTDFSQVRVHTGSSAIQMNQGLNARAFTHGSDVYFNSGEYNPGSREGKRLLGHELTHVVQQGGGQGKINRAVDSKKVSCGAYPATHPTIKVIGTTDPVGVLTKANALALKYLDRTISALKYGQSKIGVDGEAAAWPTISDCLGTSIELRFSRFDPSKSSFWKSKKGVAILIKWYENILKILNGSNLRYTCIDKYSDCGNTSWAAAIPGQYRIYLCKSFWRKGTIEEQALTLIHESSHIYYSTDDHNGRTMNNAHCLEQFVADINGIAITGEFASACGGTNDMCSDSSS